ncbi:MAG: hypothetical protein JWL84_3861 [Rhodospirillales bacterium]|nr:hypothetical protein [Rhodospirillales bacterium]
MIGSTSKSRRGLRTLLAVAGLAAVIGGASVAPALADDWHRGGDDRHRGGDDWRWQQQERREHAWRAHEWRERHERDYRVAAPGYYYPPPVVYAPQPALRLVFPFDFR